MLKKAITHCLKVGFFVLAMASQSENQIFAGTTFVTSAKGSNADAFFSISSNGVVTPMVQSAFSAGTQEGMAVDTNGNLYVASDGDTVVKYTTNGSSLFASGIGSPNILCFDNLGNLYGNSNDCIINITTNGTSVYASGISGLNGFCFDHSGNLYAASYFQLIRVTPGGTTNIVGSPISIASDTNNGNYEDAIFSVASDPSGNVYVGILLFNGTRSYFVYRVDANGMGTEIAPLFGQGNEQISGIFAVNEYTNVISAVLSFSCWGINGPFSSIDFCDDSPSFAHVAYTPLNEALAFYAPSIDIQPATQTVAAGSVVRFQSSAVGSSPIGYQWFFNQTNLLTGATNNILIITNVTSNQAGQYSMTASNFLGTTNSQLAGLNVVPSVGIVTVPAVILFGGIGFKYNVQYINQFGPTNAPWTTLATVTLTNSPQYYPDYSAIGQPSRFYRTLQVP